MKKILLTGAAGIIGSDIRPLLTERYEQVLLTDLKELTDLAPNETFAQGDVADLEFMTRLTSQVDGIVHLAAQVRPDCDFDGVLSANIIGSYTVFEAAKRTGVSHVVYASSHHAIGFLKRDDLIDDTTAPRPDTFYGLSKAFGEATGTLYADKYGINVLAIRIGFAAEQAIDERRLHTWISPRDLTQLIEIGLSTSNLGFEIVYGVSENPEPFFDNSNAERLGYVPKDRALDHLAEDNLRNAEPDTSTVAGTFVGGYFCES